MEGLWESRTPFIIAFWHGRLMMMPYIWRRGVPVHALISHHRDGRLLSRTIAHFGYATIAGSSSKGALGAVRAMADRIEAGESVAITPDGPRGPRMRAALGVVKVAGLTGAPILPASYSIRRRRVLRSWDRFLLALPFSRGVYLVGRPIRVARDADEAAVEAARRAVEAALNALTAEADRRCGHAPVEPAPLPAAAETGAARP
ncbi:MAG: lysophospholipid acyltransferase family protein [Proteobacteria bacterium]|nr:lysophospholipid acyltransferase family protein [Pseudomonadota bacterium]